MRRAAVLASLLLVATVQAQVGVGRSVEEGVRHLVENGYLKSGPGGLRNPMQPGGFNGLPAREGDLPSTPQGQENEKGLKIIKGGVVKVVGDVVHIAGPLHVRYQGYDIFGNELNGNRSTEIFNISGEAKLVGVDGVVKGSFIEANFKEKTYRAVDGDADIRPTALKGRVSDDVYVRGAEVAGGQDQVKAQKGLLTTCNLEVPHFDIRSREIDIIPGRRAILRHNDLIVLGHRIVSLPYITIPLREGADRYLPDVGENSDEGYYVKTRLGVQLKNQDSFDALVDYMTKLGLGLGGRYEYKTRYTEGRTRIYGVMGGSNTYEITSRHVQKLGSVQWTMDNSVQHKNYMNAPENTLTSTRIQFRLPRKGSQSQFNLFRSGNESPGFTYGQQTLGISDQRTWSKLFKTTMDLNWVSSESKFKTGTDVSREQINVKLSATQELQLATALLEYQRAIPVGENANFLNAADRTPVFTLRSDAAKLFKSRKFALPFQTALSVGEFMDATNKRPVSRGSFSFEFQKGAAGGYGYGIGSMGSGFGSSATMGTYGGSSYSGAFGSGSLTGGAPEGRIVTEPGASTDGTGTKPVTDPSSPAGAAAKRRPPSRLTVGYGGRFNQGMYGDDTAQYTTGFNSNVRYDLGHGSGLTVRYNYLGSHGYSPLNIDRFGSTNLMAFDVALKPARSLLLAAQSSYDFASQPSVSQTSRWQAVGLRTEWLPRNWFQMRTLTTYDTYKQKVGNIRLDVGYKPGATYVGVGARYDGIRHTWSNASLFVEGLKWNRLKFSTLLIYNGYLKEFEARHFSFTYDLHCAEAILQIIDNPVGFRSGTQIVFMIRLKAFPFDTPFGTGQRGQPLGIGSGGRQF